MFTLTADERADLWQLVTVVRDDLQDELRPDGYNLGINIGTAAGQTIEHAHIHVRGHSWHSSTLIPTVVDDH